LRDFNGKVGEEREEDIVGQFGLGKRNENGQYVIDCCRQHNLMLANTWFQTKYNARVTWIVLDKVAKKNQIDYILVDKGSEMESSIVKQILLQTLDPMIIRQGQY